MQVKRSTRLVRKTTEGARKGALRTAVRSLELLVSSRENTRKRKLGPSASTRQRQGACVIYRANPGVSVGQARKSGWLVHRCQTPPWRDDASAYYPGIKKLPGWVRQRAQIARRIRARSSPLTLCACKARRNAK